jgi:hypothetical protein
MAGGDVGMLKPKARIWWTVAASISVVHFLAVMGLGVYILHCDDLNQPSLLEPVLNVLLSPSQILAVRYTAFGEWVGLVLYANSFFWGSILAWPFCWFCLPPWQFSLRNMLIATAVVAVILGLGVWAAR